MTDLDAWLWNPRTSPDAGGPRGAGVSPATIEERRPLRDKPPQAATTPGRCHRGGAPLLAAEPNRRPRAPRIPSVTSHRDGDPLAATG